MEYVLVVIKPDGMQRNLAGFALTKFIDEGLMLFGAKLVGVDRDLAEAHYGQLKDQPFYPGLISFILGEHHGSNKVLAFVFGGEGAVARARCVAGATNPELADPLSIRGAVGRITTKNVFENVVHVSSDPQEARREIQLWFRPEETIEEIFPTEKIICNECEMRTWKTR
ncbi:MAG TPA: nucleoside-diphosphate kinase [Candidatus Bathyarchaeia archaeon]|nr:nucleoside-diphosphate kinase [Candidatus Bathyarchaeia archaeon]